MIARSRPRDGRVRRQRTATSEPLEVGDAQRSLPISAALGRNFRHARTSALVTASLHGAATRNIIVARGLARNKRATGELLIYAMGVGE